MVTAGSLKWASILKSGDKKTYIFTTSGAWGQRAVSDDIQPDDWVHLAVTHDTKSGIVIYNDGKKAGGGLNRLLLMRLMAPLWLVLVTPAKNFSLVSSTKYFSLTESSPRQKSTKL